MNDTATLDAYGVLTEPATLKIERLLPGTVDRVWAYLTQSELRRLWLASGEMELKPGAPFELVWRNEELSDPPGRRPDGFPEEQRMESHIIAVDPPRSLTFAWRQGEVEFRLMPSGNQVLLTIIHRRISDRANTVMIGAGWHMHLNILASRLSGQKPDTFWDGWTRLRDEYDRRIPA
ncbi:SRPBCC family protein [Rhizobium halophilum]|uniref:SRPBCC family protein n=1 Tax=Rhizobium halophilum TaxID=2846852 RepID=UPI001EFDC431|nr:SRPBCC family protein [Rhizobium halophilum]MCF6369446.1 SRPBCC family protein [Rhizobium halophilum]